MDARATDQWGALLAAVMALAWALTALAGTFASVAIFAGITGAVFLALSARQLTGTPRTLALTGAALLLVAHFVFVVAFIAAQPLTFKGDPGRGVNTDPPAWAANVTDAVGSWLPIAAVVAAGIALWGTWSRREQILGGAGLALVILVQILTAAGLGTGDSGDAEALLLQALFAVGFLVIAAAAALPLVAPPPARDART